MNFWESIVVSSGDFEVHVAGGSIVRAPFSGFPRQNLCALWAEKG